MGRRKSGEITFRARDLIHAKRDGRRLTPKQIAELIARYVAGDVPDYQMAAWLMAVYFRGMTHSELAALTEAMMLSGETFDLAGVAGVKADKHSTGGVGDKVSLVLAPLAAACGLRVPMISGRALAHTGGTLDKLESIPGLTTGLTRARFIRQLKSIGVAMGGQTRRFVPADRKLYALRDVTATVESIPLIAASIMSKKMAEGCEALVLDVKAGNGAFMRTTREARELAETLMGIGRAMGRRVSAIVTDMSQPLGRAVGNANEVIEAIETLRGEGPDDLTEVTTILTARMLTLGGLARSEREARRTIGNAIESGAALDKFRELVEAQGGDARTIDRPDRLRLAPGKHIVEAKDAGWLARFDTLAIGRAAMALGAGRAVMTDAIDPGVGLWVRAKLGDQIEKGQPIFDVRYRSADRLAQVRPMLEGAFRLSDKPARRPRLIRVREI